MTIEVTQYIRPYGNRARMEVDVDDSVEKNYEIMRQRGWNLAAESVQPQIVSLWVEDRPNERDIDMRVVNNGPDVIKAIEELLQKNCDD